MSYYIYKITNKINNKSYVGQSKKIRDRWVNHKRSAQLVKNGTKSITDKEIQVIHCALAKYGLENFTFEILEEVETQDQANERECYWVSYFDSYHNGYNCTIGGYNAPKTEEWKKKISEGRKGDKHWFFGKSPSEETKEKISKSTKTWYQNNDSYWLGKNFSDEHKNKISENNAHHWLGKNFSDEHRKKLSESHKGKTHPEEIKKKIGKASKGRKASKETKEKMAIAQLKFTQEEVLLMVKRYKVLKSYRKVAKEFNCSGTTVYNYLKFRNKK